LEGEVVLKSIYPASLLQKTAEINFILSNGVLFVTNYQMVFKSSGNLEGSGRSLGVETVNTIQTKKNETDDRGGQLNQIISESKEIFVCILLN
jgi:hypothetical protein